MRAIMLESFDSSPALREVPPPQIAPNEVLVCVHASSVNPVDGAIVAGMMSGMVEHEFPIVLGRDYAGVVEQVGSDVTRYAEGEEVYGRRRGGLRFPASRQPDRPRRHLGRTDRPPRGQLRRRQADRRRAR
jgi:NADPH:quinone reductase-like Zn-dependent oxidoreductase